MATAVSHTLGAGGGTVGTGTAHAYYTFGQATLREQDNNLVIQAPPGGQIIVRGDVTFESTCTMVDCETKPCDCTWTRERYDLLAWRNANLDPLAYRLLPNPS